MHSCRDNTRFLIKKQVYKKHEGQIGKKLKDKWNIIWHQFFP